MNGPIWEAIDRIRYRLRIVEVAIAVMAASLGLDVVRLLLGGA